MRVQGDLPPSGSFSIEEHPQKGGVAVVRFFENVQPYSSTVGEGENALTINGCEYDEYKLEVGNYPGLETDIKVQLPTFLAQAKLQEAERNTIPNLKSEVARLSSENEDMAVQIDNAYMAMCDVYEQALLSAGGDA